MGPQQNAQNIFSVINQEVPESAYSDTYIARLVKDFKAMLEKEPGLLTGELLRNITFNVLEADKVADNTAKFRIQCLGVANDFINDMREKGTDLETNLKSSNKHNLYTEYNTATISMAEITTKKIKNNHYKIPASFASLNKDAPEGNQERAGLLYPDSNNQKEIKNGSDYYLELQALSQAEEGNRSEVIRREYSSRFNTLKQYKKPSDQDKIELYKKQPDSLPLQEEIKKIEDKIKEIEKWTKGEINGLTKTNAKLEQLKGNLKITEGELLKNAKDSLNKRVSDLQKNNYFAEIFLNEKNASEMEDTARKDQIRLVGILKTATEVFRSTLPPEDRNIPQHELLNKPGFEDFSAKISPYISKVINEKCSDDINNGIPISGADIDEFALQIKAQAYAGKHHNYINNISSGGLKTMAEKHGWNEKTLDSNYIIECLDSDPCKLKEKGWLQWGKGCFLGLFIDDKSDILVPKKQEIQHTVRNIFFASILFGGLGLPLVALAIYGDEKTRNTVDKFYNFVKPVLGFIGGLLKKTILFVPALIAGLKGAIHKKGFKKPFEKIINLGSSKRGKNTAQVNAKKPNISNYTRPKQQQNSQVQQDNPNDNNSMSQNQYIDLSGNSAISDNESINSQQSNQSEIEIPQRQLSVQLQQQSPINRKRSQIVNVKSLPTVINKRNGNFQGK